MNMRYLFALALIVVLGLSSRKVGWIPVETGDALWAMMVFCVLRLLLPKVKLAGVAAAALAISFADEFSQLIQWPWLVSFRETTIGHLMLGQGFLWQDLVAYVVGIAVIYGVAVAVLERKQGLM